MSFRKVLFWMHLIAGVTAGVVILVMSVSGVLLAYERQLVAWADSGVIVSAAGVERLPAERLLTTLRGALPADVRATRLTRKADPRAPVTVSLSDGSTALLDPCSGAILKRSRARRVFSVLEDVHRALALGLVKHRDAGTVITGVCNAAFLFLVLSGFYLWWPRKWSRRALRSVVFFDRRKRGKARDWNWHNVFGFWCALPLLVIVFSGLLMSYPGLQQLAEKHLGVPAPSPAPPPPRPASPRAEPSLDTLFATAAQRVPGWTSITARFPPPGGAAISFSIATGDGVRPALVSRLTLDAKTGDTVRWQTYAGYGAVRKVLSWGRWLHTGEAGGIVGQTVATLASAGAALLVWTGLSLAWRRLVRGKKYREEESPKTAS